MSPKKTKKFAVAAIIVAAAALCIYLLWQPAQALYRHITHTPDKNGLYAIQGYWFDVLSPLDEASAKKFAQKINYLQSTYLAENPNVFFALVPDKGYFVKDVGYPTLDYTKLLSLLQSEIDPHVTSVSLLDKLQLSDYYQTDTHWRQDKLDGVMQALASAMDFSWDETRYTPHVRQDFVGALQKRTEKAMPPEELIYLTSESIDSATVENYQKPDFTDVYDLQLLDTTNAYDVYLSGVSPLITVYSPHASTTRELVIFRDSYASSLAPLFLDTYRTVTLIDLRFMDSRTLTEYITFSPEQDILFLYSTWVVNNSAMLR
ncbi:MAG: hypothetical protein PHG02_05295 [Oscillospiraceae bacterium]|nr:hypothetical protein [Oscillospiraceae bacterium]